jgi:glycosyltransferase involved in cell wall biosynthesis
MKVFALASYPLQAAATRFRLEQFIEPLAMRGIELSVHPFLSPAQFKQLYSHKSLTRKALGLAVSAVRRFTDLAEARKANVILVQREAMIFGPPVIEWLLHAAMKQRLVLDLDDATYISYSSPTYGALSKTLKWFSKTDDLIRWARIVICGNRAIAEYVTDKGTEARVIPTVVDTDVFRPAEARERGNLVLGWVGTHSTFPYLQSIFPVLSELALTHRFRLKIVGSGKEAVSVPNLEVENLPWEIEREVADFQSIDIGLYPIDASLYSGKWAQGKSGFKAVQYLAVGVPFVATPVGGSVDIGECGRTHFFASTDDEWYRHLDCLISDGRRRTEMGAAGRAHALAHYGLQDQAEKLAAALRDAAESHIDGSGKTERN